MIRPTSPTKMGKAYGLNFKPKINSDNSSFKRDFLEKKQLLQGKQIFSKDGFTFNFISILLISLIQFKNIFT